MRDYHDQIQYHYIILNYLCKLLSGKVRIGSDAMAFQWTVFNELSDMDLAEGVYKTVDEGMKKEGRLP